MTHLRVANVGYADHQWHSALFHGRKSSGPLKRESVLKEKMAKWDKVIAGMHDGSISVGSRIPVEGRPEWLTLEVVTGGFATGGLMAGGDLVGF